ncbi:MAG: phosphate signaling complex protein PhoU [Gammaproteobacteria bacterium]|nr:phosphate signaling complex protein PhoU [Gammaproteobacteria bacterium]
MNDGKRHIFQRFDKELDALHGQIMEMGRLVEAQIDRATDVLRRGDVAGAREMIARDSEINALDVALDERLVLLIAKRQPLARDLRELMTVSKITTDLERCGDEIRKVGRLTLRLYDTDQGPPNHKLLEDIFSLAELSGDMLHRVLEAFDGLDLQLALDVIGRQTRVEEGIEGALRRLSTYVMEDARNVGHSIQVTLALRALERIGGHAKNIAGYLVYLATGEDVRHADDDEIDRMVSGAT